MKAETKGRILSFLIALVTFLAIFAIGSLFLIHGGDLMNAVGSGPITPTEFYSKVPFVALFALVWAMLAYLWSLDRWNK